MIIYVLLQDCLAKNHYFFFVNFFKFFLRISESFRKFATNLNLLNYVVY